MNSIEIITGYYNYFNTRDWDGMLSLLDDNIAHDINQGNREIGKKAFSNFLKVMDDHYSEQVKDLIVMCHDGGIRAAAEFTIEGTYKKSQPGLPAAKGQSYRLPVGAFFEVNNGLISRVTNYYNLEHWIQLVSNA